MISQPLDEKLLLPCAVIMSANVGLFLCDALSLTVTPLLRRPVSRPLRASKGGVLPI